MAPVCGQTNRSVKTIVYLIVKKTFVNEPPYFRKSTIISTAFCLTLGPLQTLAPLGYYELKMLSLDNF
jgi:hypothetical protein